MGKLVWETPPPKPKTNIAFVPYVLGGINRDYLAKKDWNKEVALGFDAKVAVSSSLNLDMTVNPDFAQVDVDVQQTNLSRFELFFPERRQFFSKIPICLGRLAVARLRLFSPVALV
ncbi:MAG: hypothetical protein HC817_11555 [Saprospiraceae bacterium]|nr:hypothetical protein [Saprospiraceae bacterium]